MKAGKGTNGDNPYIPLKERKAMRNRLIVSLYRGGPDKGGLSMDDVVQAMKRLGYGVSKTTVFFAINGRYGSSKKYQDRRRVRNSLKNKK